MTPKTFSSEQPYQDEFGNTVLDIHLQLLEHTPAGAAQTFRQMANDLDAVYGLAISPASRPLIENLEITPEALGMAISQGNLNSLSQCVPCRLIFPFYLADDGCPRCGRHDYSICGLDEPSLHPEAETDFLQQ